jgi:hypothetical protein
VNDYQRAFVFGVLAGLALAAMLVNPFGCAPHDHGVVVYLDDSGKPYACQDQSGLVFPPTQGHCRLQEVLDANPETLSHRVHREYHGGLSRLPVCLLVAVPAHGVARHLCPSEYHHPVFYRALDRPQLRGATSVQ